jgi:hypothetical protein
MAKYGKFGARVLKGAAEGLVGQALVEPLAYGAMSYEQADYDMYDSLASLAMGGIGGAGLHSLFGVVGDAVRGFKVSTANRALRASVAQVAEGKPVNVDPILDVDPNVQANVGVVSPLDTNPVRARIKEIQQTEITDVGTQQLIKDELNEMIPEKQAIQLLKDEGVISEESAISFDKEGLPTGEHALAAEILQDAKADADFEAMGYNLPKIGKVGEDMAEGNEAPLVTTYTKKELKALPIAEIKAKITFEEALDILQDIGGEDVFGKEKLTKTQYIKALLLKQENGLESPRTRARAQEESNIFPEDVDDIDLGMHERPIEANVEITVDTEGFKQVGPQGGGNEGGLFQAPDGTKWYMKYLKPEHAINELAANLLYRLAGLKVPEYRIMQHDGKPGLASRFVEGLKNVSESVFNKLSPDQKRQVWEGYVTDVWLGNWDAPSPKNLQLDANGNILRIDHGGALIYRALGEPKGKAFGPNPIEFETFFTKSAEGPYAYNNIPKEILEESVGKVLRISNADIRAAVEAAGFQGKQAEDLIDTLVQRKHAIELRFPEVAEKFNYKIDQGFQQLWTVKSALKKIKEAIKQVHEKYTATDKSRLASYQSGDAFVVNGDLWKSMGNVEALAPTWKKFVAGMDKLLKKFSFDTNVILWRGVDIGEFKYTEADGELVGISHLDYKNAIGKTIVHHGYTSTSMSKASYVKGGPIDRVILKIEVPKGTHAAFPDAKNELTPESRVFLSSYAPGEQEVILERGLQMQINRAYIDPESGSAKKIILEVTAKPNKGTLALKKNNVKKLDGIMQDVYGIQKQGSSAADEIPLDDIEIPSVDEIVKPQKEIVVEGKVKDAGISKLEKQIQEYEKELKTYMNIQESISKGVVEPEYKKMIADTVKEFDEKIKKAQNKLNAIDAAVECVLRAPR